MLFRRSTRSGRSPWVVPTRPGPPHPTESVSRSGIVLLSTDSRRICLRSESRTVSRPRFEVSWFLVGHLSLGPTVHA